MKADIKNTFEKIYENEADAIFRFCLIRVSDREQAMDITEETFLRLWQNLLSGKEILNTRAFLFTITRNLIIDWYRKKKSIPFFKMNDAIFNEGEMGYDPSDEMSTSLLETKAEGRYLLEKISELTPSYRQPVYLRYVEDLSPVEIGEILGISANAASVRINRGLLELKKKAGYNDDINQNE
ncbi:MAG: RNA polymerase sigma factor [Candidatus Paceibacterota bacterium]